MSIWWIKSGAPRCSRGGVWGVEERILYDFSAELRAAAYPMKAKVLGAGSVGNHLTHALRSLGYSVALCDIDAQALRRTKEEIYPARYGCWDREIRLYLSEEAPRGGFDLIVIGTPPDSHIELALEAVKEEPRAILVEKPVCTPALDGVEALLAAARKRGCELFVGYDHVVGAAAKRVCELVDDGQIGEIQTLDVEFREHWGDILAAHPWLSGPSDSYLGSWRRGGGAASEHSHALNLWQHFASRVGAGRVKQVSATLDYKTEGGAEYDRLCLVNLATEGGLVGRVVQDVITKPARKWAKLQGSRGFIEWHCGYEPGKDAVIVGSGSELPSVDIFEKTRSDDFVLELEHIASVLNGASRSELDIERGLDTMMLIVAVHCSAQSHKTAWLDWDKAYSTNAIRM